MNLDDRLTAAISFINMEILGSIAVIAVEPTGKPFEFQKAPKRGFRVKTRILIEGLSDILTFYCFLRLFFE